VVFSFFVGYKIVFLLLITYDKSGGLSKNKATKIILNKQVAMPSKT
jgi:hypothetical protein